MHYKPIKHITNRIKIEFEYSTFNLGQWKEFLYQINYLSQFSTVYYIINLI